MANRKTMPTALKRKVLVEAGHRCAVPTCRQIPVEVHHIVDYAKVQEHRFENLIALCANCHTLATERRIDESSVLQYKRNLAIINGLYEPFERRVLLELANQTQEGLRAIVTAGGLTILFGRLYHH